MALRENSSTYFIISTNNIKTIGGCMGYFIAGLIMGATFGFIICGILVAGEDSNEEGD